MRLRAGYGLGVDTVIGGGCLKTVRFLPEGKTEELQEIAEAHAAVCLDEALNQMLEFCRTATVPEEHGDASGVVSWRWHRQSES